MRCEADIVGVSKINEVCHEENWTLARKSHIFTTLIQLNSVLFHPRIRYLHFVKNYGSVVSSAFPVYFKGAPRRVWCYVTGAGGGPSMGLLMITLRHFDI